MSFFAWNIKLAAFYECFSSDNEFLQPNSLAITTKDRYKSSHIFSTVNCPNISACLFTEAPKYINSQSPNAAIRQGEIYFPTSTKGFDCVRTILRCDKWCRRPSIANVFMAVCGGGDAWASSHITTHICTRSTLLAFALLVARIP